MPLSMISAVVTNGGAYNNVFGGIVAFYAVKMMHRLSRTKRPPDNFFGHNAMFVCFTVYIGKVVFFPYVNKHIPM